MTQITLSNLQVEQLDEGPVLVECRDSNGRFVGLLHVAKAVDPERIPAFTPAQLEAYEQEPGGRSLSEILADLRARR